jgi:hypothetical protein
MLTIASCSLGQTQPQSGIEGTIAISPSHGGPVRADVPSSKPLAGATFTVTNDSGTATEFTTDDQGRFKVSVPSGHYTISLKGRKGGIGHFGPFEAEVTAGQTTKVDWVCDSGMR